MGSCLQGEADKHPPRLDLKSFSANVRNNFWFGFD